MTSVKDYNVPKTTKTAPRWFMVKNELIGKFDRIITLTKNRNKKSI